MRVRDRLFDRVGHRLLRRLVAEIGRRGDHYATYHRRPKRAARVGVWPETQACPEPCAIVLQGPVDTVDDFTLETVRLYIDRDPACRVVVSTWRDTPATILDRLARAGADVVTSEKPSDPGPFNVNMQVASARAGILHARDAGAEWIVKSRTDQRLYAPNVMTMLLAMARSFPPSGRTRQRARIFGLGQGSLLYVPYHLTDQSLFGHADDVVTYYDALPRKTAFPDGWPSDPQRIFHEIPVGEIARHAAAETYLAAGFLARVGWPLRWSLEDWWGALRDCFGIVDHAATDFFWRKGHEYSLADKLVSYDAVTTRREIDFPAWLLLHAGLLEPSAARAYEAVQSARFNERLERPGPSPQKRLAQGAPEAVRRMEAQT